VADRPDPGIASPGGAVTKYGVCKRYVYCYDVLDLRTGKVAKAAYIGKSSSNLRYRNRQHREKQVWAKHIVGDIQVLWSGDCTLLTLWHKEIFFILTMRPLFNVEWNKANGNRIPPWQAKKLYGKR
jgi:hypothetical protein